MMTGGIGADVATTQGSKPVVFFGDGATHYERVWAKAARSRRRRRGGISEMIWWRHGVRRHMMLVIGGIGSDGAHAKVRTPSFPL